MTGGADADIFQFNALSDLGDSISNFDAENDLIHFALSGPRLSGLGPTAGQFRIRSDNLARDADDRFIFRTTDKTLWFDADGKRGKAAVLVADLQQSATLTAEDIRYLI